MVQIAVVGAGQMGVKIAGEFAYHGHRVKIYDVNTAALNKVHDILEDDVRILNSEGLLPQKHFLGQVFCMSHLEETVRDADFIFEVIVENLELKQDIFEMDGATVICRKGSSILMKQPLNCHEEISLCCKESAIIASNTLRLDINLINERAVHKQRTLGLRFLFPVYCIPEIEILPAKLTDGAVIEKVRKLIERMGKTLFFRSGDQPLILTEKQREERKAARQEEMQLMSASGTHIPRVVPALHHTDNESVHILQREAAMIIPSDLNRDCAICMDRLRDCLFIPCHHMVTCCECGQILQERRDACPVCRKDIDKAVRIYHT